MFVRLQNWLSKPVDIAWLSAYRAIFGATMCVSMLRFIGYGWIDPLFVEPTFRFKYWGFQWLPELSAGGVHALFWALAALALTVGIGLCFRVTSLLFALGFTYLGLIDVSNYLNHYYLAALLAFIFACSPANRAWSVDAWLRPRITRIAIPSAWLTLFRVQIGVVYTFAGVAKAQADWLVHAQPLRIWLSSRTDMPLLGPLFSEPWAAPLMSWGGFLFDTSIPWLLLATRTRPFAYLAVIGFHAVTRALFPIGMFPFIMTLGALVFFPPSWPRQLLARLPAAWTSFARDIGPIGPSSATLVGRVQPAWVAIGALYCLLQIAIPLRFLAYGGDVRWHEQGMRFSWRVMVREKNGSATFVVRNKDTGRTWHVEPRAYLTRLQEREMAGQPDLILQLAHHVRDDLERRGRGPVEVRVDSRVSLNGRLGTPLIDPTVDLAAVSDGLARASWIAPAPTSLPIRLRPLPSRSGPSSQPLARTSP